MPTKVTPGKPRFLCVCDGGNVRSFALAYVLHDLLGYEAVPVGRLRVSAKTLAVFCDWTDVIVIMQPHMEESVPERFKKKIRCMDVGVDRFGMSVNGELLEMVKRGADEMLTEMKCPPK